MRARRTCSILAALLFLGAAFFLEPRTATAQFVEGLDLGPSEGPIEIDAEEGIEWNREQKTYVAKGNARAARGDLAVYGDTLTAYYRESEGGTEIWRISAEGKVRLTSPTETIFGDKATYDIDKAVVTIVGEDLRVETPNELLTAEDSLEYWNERNEVIARGNAVVTQGDKRVSADTLTGTLDKDAEGKQELVEVKATGNVQVSSPTEYVRADEAVYDLRREVATLTGNVKITRGDNQLNGQFAEVNMKTGLSRITGDPKGGKGRVHTLIVPGEDAQLP